VYRNYILVIFASVYIGLHAVFGYLHCEENFCPGDHERDYVYTVKDEDGKIWYIENGKPISEADYKKAHANLFEFVEKDTNNGKK
jgi:hypothetical protein